MNTQVVPSIKKHLGSALVSVVIPCFNAAAYLKEAIESIIHQSYRNLEIIIINDGSTDASPSMLMAFAEKDPRIRLIHHAKNEGLVASLNEGVCLASGMYIARMDADDVSLRDRIEVLVNYLLLHPEIDVVSSGFYFINEGGEKSVPVIPKAKLPKALKFIALFSTPVAHAAMLGKTDCLRQFPYDRQYIHSEDYDLFSRMAYADLRLSNVPYCLYKIRINPQGVSYTYESQQVESHTKISLRNVGLYFGKNPDPKVHQVAINRFSGSVGVSNIREALEFLVYCEQEYLKRESCNDEEKKEIAQYLDEQRLDILIQVIKNWHPVKPFSFMPLIGDNMKAFAGKKMWKYFIQKIRIKGV